MNKIKQAILLHGEKRVVSGTIKDTELTMIPAEELLKAVIEEIEEIKVKNICSEKINRFLHGADVGWNMASDEIINLIKESIK